MVRMNKEKLYRRVVSMPPEAVHTQEADEYVLSLLNAHNIDMEMVSDTEVLLTSSDGWREAEHSIWSARDYDGVLRDDSFYSYSGKEYAKRSVMNNLHWFRRLPSRRRPTAPREWRNWSRRNPVVESRWAMRRRTARAIYEANDSIDSTYFARPVPSDPSLVYVLDFDGYPVTRIEGVTDVYPVGSSKSVAYDHPNGIILTSSDAEYLGLYVEV